MSKEEIRKLNFVDLDKKQSETKKRSDTSKNEETFGYNNLKNSTESLFKRISIPSLKSSTNKEEVLTLEGPKEDNFNPNFLSSVFKQDKQEAGGISRVFRKSMIFLALQLCSFLIFITTSFNFFNNPLIALVSLVVSVAMTNLFFIIVADRSYVWLALLGQALLIVIANSFLGLAFTPITLLFTLVAILFYFLAYSELEKIQLSSRLFSISHITGESTRIILTATTLLLALGIFNSILWQGQKDNQNLGSKPFLSTVVFDNKFIMDNLFIGKTSSVSINKFLISGNFYKDASTGKIMYEFKSKTGNTEKQATFGTFLEYNYESNDVLTTKEEQDYRATSCTDVGSISEGCNQRVKEEINKKIEQWRLKAYADLPYTIDTPLTITNYREITKKFYLNRVAEFESEKGDSGFIDKSLLLVPLTSIIPAIFALTVAVLLFLTRFIFSWIVFIINWIIWRVLLISGFVQIDVETVEAEIISI
jgi:hypothetical protein